MEVQCHYCFQLQCPEMLSYGSVYIAELLLFISELLILFISKTDLKLEGLTGPISAPTQ